jgi:hypothetical protein
LYVNGTRYTTESGNSTSSSTTVNIGSRNNAAYYLTGYISNLKVSNYARYNTTTIPVPTTPAVPDANTSLLLNFTNGGIVDATGKNNLETLANSSVQTKVLKYGNGSLLFNGTSGSYSRIQAVGDLYAFSTGNLTIEFWAYFNSTASSQFLTGLIGASSTFAFYMPTTSTVGYYLSSSGSSWDIASGVTVGTITTGQWYRISLVRNGNTFTPYLDTTAGTPTNSSSALKTPISGAVLTIGANSTGGDPFNGYIEGLRITRGIARSMTSLPTGPFPLG